MSLLNFLFKNRQEKGANLSVEDTVATEVLERHTAASSDPAPALAPSVADAFNATTDDRLMDLDQIREALHQIAEILKDDDERAAQKAVSGNFTTIELTLGQTLDMVPGIFQNACVPQNLIDVKVNIFVENLYEQLSTGNVTTTVGRIVSDISEDLLVPDYESYRKDEVSIPLDLIVANVQQDEFNKRITTEEIDVGFEDMPNLFQIPGSSSKNAPAALFKPFAAVDSRPSGKDITQAPELPKPPDPVGPGDQAGVPDEQIASVPTAPDDIFDRPNTFQQPDAAEEEASSIRFTDPFPAPPEYAAGLGGDLGLKANAGAFEFVIDDSVNVFKLAGSADTPTPPVDVDDTSEAAAIQEPEPERAPDLEPELSMRMAETVLDEGERVLSLDDDSEEGDDVDDRDDDAAWLPASVAAAGAGAVLLHGVNLNRATADEIAERIEGVGVRMADRIVRFRDQRGPFKDVADLSWVPGVGPTTFERVTGVSWSEARDQERRTLRFLIGGGEDLPDLRAVAGRFRDLPGIDGCVIIHEDGHVMASHWEDERAEILGAVAPQIFKKILPYAEEIDMGELNPVTLYLGENALTIVQCGDLFIAVVHSTHAMSKRQIRLIQLAGFELEQRVDKCKASV